MSVCECVGKGFVLDFSKYADEDEYPQFLNDFCEGDEEEEESEELELLIQDEIQSEEEEEGEQSQRRSVFNLLACCQCILISWEDIKTQF